MTRNDALPVSDTPPVSAERPDFDEQLRALNRVLQEDPVIGPWGACTGSNKPNGCACHMVWSRAWDFPILHTLSHKDESYTCGEGLVEDEAQKLARYVALLDPEFVRDLVRAISDGEAARQYHMNAINRIAATFGALGETSEVVADRACAYAMDVRAAATRFLDEYRKEFYSGTEGPWSDPPDPLDVAYQALRAALATNTTSSAHARSVSEVARNDSGKPSERMEVSTPHEDTPRSDYALVPPATLAGDWGKALPICRHCGQPLPEGFDEEDCMANPMPYAQAVVELSPEQFAQFEAHMREDREPTPTMKRAARQHAALVKAKNEGRLSLDTVQEILRSADDEPRTVEIPK